MKKLYLFLTAALLALASCTNEKIPAEATGSYGTIMASIEQGSTKSRLAVQPDNSLKWTEGDVIKVFMNNGESYSYTNKGNDVFESETPVPSGTSNSDVIGVLYEGIDDEGSFVGGSVTNSELETWFAQNVTYQSVSENTINLPMWGVWNDGHISFKHLAGILRVSLTGLPVDYDMLSVIASNPIAGRATVEDVTISEPVLVMTENGENLVNIRFTATSDDNQDKTIYVPLPVGTYESIKVIVSQYDENLSEGDFKNPLELAYWRNKTVERATIYTGSVTYTEVSDIDALNSVLQNVSDENKNAHVVVSEVISGNENEVEIPEVNNSIVTLDFNTVADNASLTINSGEGESTSASQNIAVNVGNTTSESADLILNTPTSTVELGAGNFSTITATTATNTLIINGGVKIQKLTILGGNVLIEAGVEIGQIENPGNGIINYIVRSEDGLKYAFANGGKYQVYDDITITDKNGLRASNGISVVLDLNDKTITTEGYAFIAETDGTLTLNGNGFVKAGNTVGNWVAVWANGGTVTINDGNYSVGLDSDDSNSCVYVENGGQVTINGGTFSHEIPTSGNNNGMPLQVNDDDVQGKITVNAGVFILDNGHFYEDQDETAGKIIFNADQKKDKDRIIVTGAFGNTVVINNSELSDALYKLYGDVYYIKINGNGYAQMRESEVLAVRELRLDPYWTDYQGRITTLIGIENFVNLEYLDCRIPDLKKCDFSKNVKLKSVAIQHTTELTSLDFSNNPELQALYMNYNEGLTSLNLTGCTKLYNIQLFGSGLTSLDIPNKEGINNLLFGGSLRLNPADYPNLTGLGCENMELTDLDSFIPDAMKSQLTFISCSSNKLTALDLSKYPNLQNLSCDGNQIEELDPSKTPNLSSLGCSGNKIQTLDISNNVGLNQLWCSGQRLDGNMILRLTLNQKAILVDNNAYFEPSLENVTLEIVNKSTTNIENLKDGGNW